MFFNTALGNWVSLCSSGTDMFLSFNCSLILSPIVMVVRLVNYYKQYKYAEKLPKLRMLTYINKKTQKYNKYLIDKHKKIHTLYTIVYT